MKEHSVKPMLIQQLDTLSKQIDQPSDQLAEQLAELSESFQEANFLGMGDLLALISELVSSEETTLTPAHQIDVAFILSALGNKESFDDLLATTVSVLTAPSWRAPLGEEDIGLLPKLLLQIGHSLPG